MKTKCLVLMISVLLMIGVGSSALAVTDPVDSLDPNYEIVGASAVVFPVVTGQIPEYVAVKLDMGTTKIPGMVTIEFDIDGNTATGGSLGLPGIFNTCLGGSKIKVEPGFDVAISLVLREQGPDAPTAWCSGCTGTGGYCFLKTETCIDTPPCGTADCYKGIGSCVAGDPNCYFASERCTQLGQPNCDQCFELVEPCTTDKPCGIGRVIGEWYAMSSGGSGLQAPVERGRIQMPLPKATDQTGSDIYTFPYGDIVLATKLAGGTFDLEKAKDPANYLKFQVAAWEDPSYATTKNDFIDLTAFCVEVVDVVPNTGKLAVYANSGTLCKNLRNKAKCCDGSAAEGRSIDFAICQGYTSQTACLAAGCYWNGMKGYCSTDICTSDLNFDGKVSIPDLVIIKRDFGRTSCPCQ